jgi:hypothetical protein
MIFTRYILVASLHPVSEPMHGLSAPSRNLTENQDMDFCRILWQIIVYSFTTKLMESIWQQVTATNVESDGLIVCE